MTWRDGRWLGASGDGEKSDAVVDATTREPGVGARGSAAFYPTPSTASVSRTPLTPMLDSPTTPVTIDPSTLSIDDTAPTDRDPARIGPAPWSLDRVRIVLVAASHPGNVGATARAMKVMGLSRLSLVTPRFPDVLTQPDALAFASGAVDVLERASTHATLDDALAGCVHAIAMSARDREYAPPATTLRDAASTALSIASGGDNGSEVADVAFVFGSERYGLSNDDVLRCQARCRVETSAEYGSLNLAQAVQLVAYECRQAALAARPGTTPETRPAPATHAEREALIDHLEQGLLAIGYLDPDAPKKLMPRLRRLFARARLERDEVQWLRGIAKAMLGAGRHAVKRDR